MKLFFCPKPATALLVCCALVAAVSAQETPETPAPSNSGLTTTAETPAPSNSGLTTTAETPAPSNSDLTTGTDETPAPVHVHTDDMEHDDETMGPTASPADDEGDGAAAIGGSARMTAVVSCALAALAAGAAWGL